MRQFGFEVREMKQGLVSVLLPHQCDAWGIAGDDWDGVPRELAIRQFERFIAEAETALQKLKDGPR